MRARVHTHTTTHTHTQTLSLIPCARPSCTRNCYNLLEQQRTCTYPPMKGPCSSVHMRSPTAQHDLNKQHKHSVPFVLPACHYRGSNCYQTCVCSQTLAKVGTLGSVGTLWQILLTVPVKHQYQLAKKSIIKFCYSELSVYLHVCVLEHYMV